MLHKLMKLSVLFAQFLFMHGAALAQSPLEKFSVHAPQSEVVVDHSAWTTLLQKYVRADQDGLNRVDYAAWQKDSHAALKSYIKTLSDVHVTRLGRDDQFAFWANLYNAKTIDIILDHYPVKSIKDISLGGSLTALVTGGPWKAKVVTVSGTELSLDDIEHGIMREIFERPDRVHYAVNCASVGCPNLQTRAFVGETLNEDLGSAARAYVNSPRGARIHKGRLIVSSIYSWFQDDFGGSEQGVLTHLRSHANDALKDKLSAVRGIDDYAYDWTLNTVK